MMTNYGKMHVKFLSIVFSWVNVGRGGVIVYSPFLVKCLLFFGEGDSRIIKEAILM